MKRIARREALHKSGIAASILSPLSSTLVGCTSLSQDIKDRIAIHDCTQLELASVT